MSLVPILILLSCLLLAVLASIYILSYDLLDKGCLAWHRKSLGFYSQVTVFFICLLLLMTNLMLYIKAEFEETPESPSRKLLLHLTLVDESIMKCFTPIIVFAVLYLLKIILFKTKNTAI